MATYDPDQPAPRGAPGLVDPGATRPAPAIRLCAIVPVYNHGLTVGDVVAGTKALLPVIAVDDGSTDQTPAVLKSQTGITVISLPVNEGKAVALRTGFAAAQKLGFTHAITIDADGQHPVAVLPEFIRACEQNPEALITGVRNLKSARAPRLRQLSNAISNFWFRLETGVPLGDTQCGLRVYPLLSIQPIQVRSTRYAFELEVMVKASWAGVPLLGLPMEADYAAPTSRLSHFRPVSDFLRISLLHLRLVLLSIAKRTRST